jgi:hypothetical protein
LQTVIEQYFEPAILLGAHAGIAGVIVALLTRWAKMDYKRILAIIGAVGVTLFVICIGIPYFFQGYAHQGGVTGIPLGWTKNPAIGLFAYLYTFKWAGFAWLFTSTVCSALGRFSASNASDALAKSGILLFACIMLTRLDAFAQTINPVLE